jgi:Zn ribbon nucleic-acid-binding protein
MKIQFEGCSYVADIVIVWKEDLVSTTQKIKCGLTESSVTFVFTEYVRTWRVKYAYGLDL